jgi:WD40 repeat protein
MINKTNNKQLITISLIALLTIQCQLIATLPRLPVEVGTAIPQNQKEITQKNENKIVQIARWDPIYITGYIYDTDISKDGKYIAASSTDGTFQIMETINGATIFKELNLDHGIITAISFATEQNEIFLGYQDGTFTKRNFDGAEIYNIALQPIIRDITYFSANNQLAVTSYEDFYKPETGQIQFIDSQTGDKNEAIKGTSIDFLPNGESFILGTGNGQVELWKFNPMSFDKVLDKANYNTTRVLASPDGNIVLAISENYRSSGDIRLTQIKDSSYITALWATQEILSVSCSPNNQIIATSTAKDNAIQLWNLPGGQMLSRLIGHTRPVTSIDFSPDGKGIISGSMDGTIRFWGIP